MGVVSTSFVPLPMAATYRSIVDSPSGHVTMVPYSKARITASLRNKKTVDHTWFDKREHVVCGEHAQTAITCSCKSAPSVELLSQPVN